MNISIVIPVYNEEENLEILIESIIKSISQYDYEILCVDDGSTDNSFFILNNIAAENTRLKLIRFNRNYGQSAAMYAGINHANGDIILFMDADLQNDPEDIPFLLDSIKAGFDIVSGRRKNRQDPLFRKRIPSQIANLLLRKLTGIPIHDFGCTLKAFRKETIKNIVLYGELHRFIAALGVWAGGTITEISVKHHPRKHGKSKYGILRTFKVLLDLLNLKFIKGYRVKPSYVFGGIGIFFLLFGFLLLFVVAYRTFILQRPQATPLIFIMVISFNAGIQSILIGLLAELMINLEFHNRKRIPYEIHKTINL